MIEAQCCWGPYTDTWTDAFHPFRLSSLDVRVLRLKQAGAHDATPMAAWDFCVTHLMYAVISGSEVKSVLAPSGVGGWGEGIA